MDSASSAIGAGAGIVIITSEGIWLEHSFRLRFRATNNEAEYEALLAGLRSILGVVLGTWRLIQTHGWWLAKYMAVLKPGILE